MNSIVRVTQSSEHATPTKIVDLGRDATDISRADLLRIARGSIGHAAVAEAHRQSGGSWRSPVSYRSIETLAVIADILTILSAGLLASAIYGLATAELPSELTNYTGAAAVVAALFTSVVKERGLYKPTILLAWTAQIRSVTIAWFGVFFFLSACVFALKIGSTFSRGTIILFAVIGLSGLIAQRTLWRVLLERGMATGKLSGRAVILISDNSAVSELKQDLLRHGFQVQRHFLLGLNSSHSSQWDDIISQAVTYARGSNVDEVFIAAEPQSWVNFHEATKRLRLLPLPVNFVAVGPTSELFKRPLSAIGATPIIELQRAPRNYFELLVKRAVDIVLAGTALVALMPVLAIAAVAIKLKSPGPVIFRQRRHGFNGKPFHILKFRTMNVLEDGELHKTSGARRQTRDSRWIVVAAYKH